MSKGTDQTEQIAVSKAFLNHSFRKTARDHLPDCPKMVQSHPPFYIKAISVLSSFVFGSVASRNIFRPGQPIFLPNDANLQLFFYGGSQLTRGQECLSNLTGHMTLIVIGTKLATVFSATSEGTFLRRNLLVVFGVTQVLTGISIFSRFEGDLNQAGGSFKGLAGVMIVEGSMFLYDALFRARPVKKDKSKKN